ncbi:MAG: hypothetical protein LC687_08365 [Actinobacteria bacterium]|nr:hypothetical protein [Actinomycetota bacterium]
MTYRVRRNIPGNTYVQLKSAPRSECKRVLRSLADKWEGVASLGFGPPFSVELEANELIVEREGVVVDHYIIEEAK